MHFGVVIFPGSNCDDDLVHVLQDVIGQKVSKIWHKETSLSSFGDLDGIFIPGGFSYGDYLRSGAIARFSPVMKEVIKFANDGGLVVGICNGFQILCEAGLLPGTLQRNINEKFICRNVHLKCEDTNSPVSINMTKGDIFKIPIAHAEGRYFTTDEGLKSILDNNQVIFRYVNEAGETTTDANINGSLESIAGICNKERNVFGMMPHPERSAEVELGNQDGKIFFESILDYLKESIIA